MIRPTLRRAERGDPSVSARSYALILQALGLLGRWGDIDDPVGDQLAIEQLPKAVRSKRWPSRSIWMPLVTLAGPARCDATQARVGSGSATITTLIG